LTALPPLNPELIPRDIQLQQDVVEQFRDGEVDLGFASYGGARRLAKDFPAARTTNDQSIENEILNYERNLEKVHYSNEKINEEARRLLVYPFDLSTSKENMDYIVFDIYESNGAGIKTVTEKIEKRDSTGLASTSQIATIGIVAKEAEGIVAKVGGGSAIAALSQSDALIEGISGLSRSGERLLNPNLGKGEIGISQEVSGFAQPTDKVKTSIALSMPATVDSKYGLEYESKDFSDLSLISTAGKGIVDAISGLLGGEKNEDSAAAMDAAMKVVGQQSLKMVDRFLTPLMSGEGGAGLGDLVSAQLRAVPNPLVLQLFKAVKRREFTMSYDFVPLNEKEALHIYDIIRTFKKYSHPKRAAGGRYLEFPAEFRMTFMHGTSENLYLPRITRCVLTGIDVKYGTEEGFVTFQKKSGREGAPPIKISMTLTFSEVEILTAERIDQGY
jgi:hypothetical protein